MLQYEFGCVEKSPVPSIPDGFEYATLNSTRQNRDLTRRDSFFPPLSGLLDALVDSMLDARSDSICCTSTSSTKYHTYTNTFHPSASGVLLKT